MTLCTLRNLAAFVLVFGFMPGCASLGLETPQTFRERIAAAYVSVTTARTLALQGLQAKRITADDAAHVQALADRAREGVDAARRIEALGTGAGADDRLRLTEALLAELSAYLARRGIKP